MSKKVKPDLPLPAKPAALFNISFQIKAAILTCIALVFYINTASNQYALDDSLVINNNAYVQKGFEGIGKILGNDTFDSYNHMMHSESGQQLSGGRYRPLSVIVFAIEHAFFGESPAPRHIINVLAYMLCVFSIFYFLSRFLLAKLDYGEDMAFFAILLFAIHPIHTEVVANIKSLDEILSLTFIMCTFIFSLKYAKSNSLSDMILGMVSFLLALLSKEYAISLVVLLPMLFYVYSGKSLKECLIQALPYFAAPALYLFMRFSAVGLPHELENNKLLTNPYLYATPVQRLATEIFVLGKYIALLFWPHPLSADYSYAQIPYYNFSSPLVWMSLLVYIGLTALGVKLLLKRNMMAFPIFLFLGNIALVSNIGLDLGATMGERLVFHSSLGFAVLLAYAVFMAVKGLNAAQQKPLIITLSVVLTIACCGETVTRNKQWKNDATLFIADVNSAPNSFMTNGNAGMGYIKLAMDSTNAARKQGLFDTAIMYLRKSIGIFKNYDVSYYNLGVCYLNSGNVDMAKIYWDSTKAINPTYPPLVNALPLLAKALFNKGQQYHGQGNVRMALKEIKEALFYDSQDPDIWYNLGGAYYTVHEPDSARYCWSATLQLNPNYAGAKQGLAALPKEIKDTVKGVR